MVAESRSDAVGIWSIVGQINSSCFELRFIVISNDENVTQPQLQRAWLRQGGKAARKAESGLGKSGSRSQNAKPLNNLLGAQKESEFP